MGARGNIVVHTSPDERIFVYTHWNGRQLDAILREALRRCERRDDGGRLCATLVLAMCGEAGEPDCVVTTRRIFPDFDELHVYPDRGFVERVTMDWLIGSDGMLDGMETREVGRWTFEEFLAAEAPVASR